jgi:filamentous hemagglutinin family protein
MRHPMSRVCGSISSIALSFTVAIAAAEAQIIPDSTLGAESSVVVPNLLIQGVPSDRIDGGALRGSNLFHSFQEFNISAGQAAYFANPIGIANILSRVTGNNPSTILGRLGVLGNANLFLLNPNGVLFGANASLDIPGSLTVTTAEAIPLGQVGLFSATEPQRSTLISVAPGALFLNALANQSATIVNQGQLATGQDFTLAAGKLTLMGQLQAGKNLTLLAADTVQIQDSATTPFVAIAGQQLLIQGDRSINILALNHPNSALYAMGDLLLRSSQPVAGDAHYWAGGNFRIEQLDGSLGALFSPKDPIIFASGDVAFDSYTGASLHILAGGSVTIGDVTITDPDFTGNAISPATNPALATVTLSNGTSLQIDGTTQATLDIRAGTTAFGTPGITGANFTNLSPLPPLTDPATSADITIGSITLNQPGLVFLTNQYQPNLLLPSASITVGGINAGSNTAFVPGNGSPVVVDARGNFALNGLLDTASFAGNGGDVTLLAAGDITVDAPIDTSDQFSGVGNAGNITLRANGNITVTQNSTLFAPGVLGGNITLNSGGDTTIATGILTESSTTDPGTTGGSITITARSLFATNALLSTSNFGLAEANSGNITVEVSDLAIFDASPVTTVLNVDATTTGNGGDINITAREIVLTNGTTFDSGTLNQGEAGDINLQATDRIILDGTSSIISRVFAGASNSGGDITIETELLSLDNQSSLQTETSGQGDAGNISVTAERVELANGATMTSAVGSTAIGQGGKIQLQTNSLTLTTAARISASTSGQGDAGDIQVIAPNGKVSIADPLSKISTQTSSNQGNGGTIDITARTFQVTNNATLDASTTASRAGGNITINADTFEANTGGQLLTSTSSSGAAGDITVNADDTATLSGADTGLFASTATGSTGDGGDIKVTTGNFQITSGAVLDAQTQGTGNGGSVTVHAETFTATASGKLTTSTSGSGAAGDITVNADEATTLSGADTGLFANTAAGSTGNGGDIKVTTGNFQIEADAVLDAQTQGSGNGGSVTVHAGNFTATTGGKLTTSTSSSGAAGDIRVNADDSFKLVGNGTGLFASSTAASTGNSGSVFVTAPDVEISDRAGIAVNSLGQGNAGSIAVQANSVTLDRQAFLTAATASGEGGNILLQLDDLLLMRRNSLISAEAGGTGNGGNVTIDATFVVTFLEEDNDISANAFQGRGGNIDITAQGLFGFLTLNRNTPFSDITASSTLGIDGVVQINTPDIDIQSSVTGLPDNFTTSDQVVAGSCLARGRASRGSFTVTGAGGLAPTPYDPQISGRYNITVVQPLPAGGGTGDRATQPTQPQPVIVKRWRLGDPIQEAHGMIVAANGRKLLDTTRQLATIASAQELICQDELTNSNR